MFNAIGHKFRHWSNRINAGLIRVSDGSRLIIPAGQRVISFTFDDVPQSALTKGAEILEKYGIAGTFYISGGLTGTVEPRRRLIEPQGVDELQRRGHEIGCHTFSHPRIPELNSAQICDEIQLNHSFLDQVTGQKTAHNGKAARNFAYPYNAVSFKHRELFERSYRTCRAGQNRINRGTVKQAMLYSMEICQPEDVARQLTSKIDELMADPGWLIFFTHDISDRPTPYGCTPETFEYLVQYAVQSGSEILSVAQALDRFDQTNNVK